MLEGVPVDPFVVGRNACMSAASILFLFSFTHQVRHIGGNIIIYIVRVSKCPRPHNTSRVMDINKFDRLQKPDERLPQYNVRTSAQGPKGQTPGLLGHVRKPHRLSPLTGFLIGPTLERPPPFNMSSSCFYAMQDLCLYRRISKHTFIASLFLPRSEVHGIPDKTVARGTAVWRLLCPPP